MKKDSFETFRDCEVLKLKDLGIVDMENGVFSTMHNLVELYIEGDKIDIRAGIFEGLELAKGTLSLTNMSINTLPDKVFASFDHLWELYLDNNPLSNLNAESFYGLNEVSDVSLVNTNVDDRSGLFKHLPKLDSLDISGTPFTFTPGMWDQISLKELILENAGLTDLTVDIWTGMEGSLRELFLPDNHFETIEAFVFQGLTKVWFLNLVNCGIKHIRPRAFEGLESLVDLCLDDNPIITIDESMFGPTHLENQVTIWLGCGTQPCFSGLCWIYQNNFDTNLEWCETRCENPDRSVEEFIENEC